MPGLSGCSWRCPPRYSRSWSRPAPRWPCISTAPLTARPAPRPVGLRHPARAFAAWPWLSLQSAPAFDRASAELDRCAPPAMLYSGPAPPHPIDPPGSGRRAARTERRPSAHRHRRDRLGCDPPRRARAAPRRPRRLAAPSSRLDPAVQARHHGHYASDTHLIQPGRPTSNAAWPSIRPGAAPGCWPSSTRPGSAGSSPGCGRAAGPGNGRSSGRAAMPGTARCAACGPGLCPETGMGRCRGAGPPMRRSWRPG